MERKTPFKLTEITKKGVKGAEVPLREVGDEYPPYRNLFILKKR